MAEAIARVQRVAGALSDQIQGLQRDSNALVGDLQRVDSQARAAADTLMRYRQAAASGQVLGERELANIEGLKQFIIARGGAPGQAFVARFEQELGGGPPPPPAPGQPAATPPPQVPPAPGPRIVPPPIPPRPVAPEPPRVIPGGIPWQRQPAPGGDQAVDTGEQAQREADRTQQAATTTARALGAQEEAYRRADAQKRTSGLTERELQREWRETSKLLNAQQRDLDAAEKSFDRLQRWKRMGFATRREEAMAAEMPDRIADLRAGLQQFRLERDTLRAEAERRGYQVEGDRLIAPGVGGLRSFLMGLGGGLGGGGGSLVGAGIGVLAGRMNPAAFLGSLGLAAGVFGYRSAQTYEQTQRRVFDTGMRLGGGFGALRDEAMERLRGPLRMTFDETLGAKLALGMQTGRTDIEGIATLARAYGLPVESTAQLIGQMGALGVMPPTRRVEETRVTEVANPAYPAARANRELALSGHLAMFPGERSRDRPEIAAALFGEPLREQRLAEVGDLRRRLAMTTDPGARTYLEARLQERGAILPRDLMPLPLPTIEQRRVETREVGGLPAILAGAYQASAYRALPADRRDAMMSAFLEQTGRLLRAQGAGGAPILDFERMPAMLGAATRMFGPEVHPQFGANVVAGITGGLTQPQGDVQRSIAMRAVLRMGREMTPEQLEKFRKDTERQVPGGIDPRTYTGAMAAMQNAFALPPDQGARVIRAMVEGIRSVTGRGTQAEELFWTERMGGKAALGITAARRLDELLAAKGEGADRELLDLWKKKFEAAGPEAKPWELDARVTEVETTVGMPLKRIAQTLLDGVLDLADKLRAAENALEGGVPMTPANPMSGGFGQ